MDAHVRVASLRAIRLADSDRLWVADAEALARALCEIPDPDADEPEVKDAEDEEDEVTIATDDDAPDAARLGQSNFAHQQRRSRRRSR